jgi:phenylacetic acid degradation operon negative regulatory protein
MKVTLLVVAMAGTAAAAVVAPNVAAVMERLPRREQRRRVSPHDVRRAIAALQRRHLLERSAAAAPIYRPTAAGRLEVRLRQLSGVLRRRRWDGRWRLVLFDVPTGRKGVRDVLRRTLHDIGFLEVQKSVYLYPYDVFGVLGDYRQLYHLRHHVLFATVEALEGDQRYRQAFGLTR